MAKFPKKGILFLEVRKNENITKKILIPIVILAGGSWGVYNYYYGGEAYYTQITTSGEKKDEKTNSGEAMTIYYYQQPAFNKNGEEKNRGIKRSP